MEFHSDYVIVKGKISDEKKKCVKGNFCTRNKVDENAILNMKDGEGINIAEGVNISNESISNDNKPKKSLLAMNKGNLKKKDKEVENKNKKEGKKEMRSIEDVIKEVKENNGMFFKLNGQGYKSSTTDTREDMFSDDGNGYAYPTPVYSVGKCSIGLNFKEYGSFNLKMFGGNGRVDINRYKTRHIKKDGELKIKSIGVVFPSAVNIKELKELKSEQNKSIIGFFRNIVSKEENKKEFDTDNIAIYKWEIDEGMIECNAEQLKEDDLHLFETISIKGSLKNAVSQIEKEKQISESRPDLEEFANLSDEDKNILRENGVNLKTGTYNKPYDANNKVIKADDSIVLEVVKEGWSSAVSGKEMLENKSSKKFAEEVLNQEGADTVRAEYNKQDGINMQTLNEIKKKAEKEQLEASVMLAKKIISSIREGKYKKAVIIGSFKKCERATKSGTKVYYQADNEMQVSGKNIDIKIEKMA